MISNLNGDLLKSKCDIICHQVNTYGCMGAGIAKQIKEQFPLNFKMYQRVCTETAPLGLAIMFYDGGRTISNFFSQVDGSTNYFMFAKCLGITLDKAKRCGQSVGLPKYIGCGIADGDWNVIYAIIESASDAYPSVDIEIWEFVDKPCEIGSQF